MPKLERLLELARMTRDRRVKNVREMSRACGVSQRTIYRYLNTLAVIDVPNELGRGGEQKGCDDPGKTLDADDRCLIRHLLDHHPLAQRAFFAPRLDRLRRTFAPAANAAGRRLRGRLFEVSLSRLSTHPSAEDRWLDLFAGACNQKRNLRIVTRSKRSRDLVLSPEAVRLSDGAIQLRFRDPASRKTVRLDLDDLVSMRFESRGGRPVGRATSSGKKG